MKKILTILFAFTVCIASAQQYKGLQGLQLHFYYPIVKCSAGNDQFYKNEFPVVWTYQSSIADTIPAYIIITPAIGKYHVHMDSNGHISAIPFREDEYERDTIFLNPKSKIKQ